MQEDIQGKKDVMQAFKRSDAYNRVLFETSPIGLALCRINGELVDVNQAYADIIGRGISETLSLTYWDITPKEFEAEEAVQIESLSQTGKYGPYQKKYIHKDGHLVPVRLNGQIIKLKNEEFIWSSVENISSEVQFKLKQEELKQQLMQSQKLEALGQLVGGVAHDFNNTLSCIAGFSSLGIQQLHRNNHDKLEHYFNRIQNASDQSRDTIKSLLTFLRGEQGEKQLLSVCDSLSDCRELISISLPKNISLTFNVPKKSPKINANINQLKQVLLNLCLNAKDAIGKLDGHIIVSVSISKEGPGTCQSCKKAFNGKFVKIEVKDTGCGISKDNLERMFNPFFTTKEIGKGTGMGLAMAHGIVHEHNGHILVNSTLGKGSTVSLMIPLVEADKKSNLANHLRLHSESIEEYILVVDDNKTHAALVEEILTSNDFKVDKINDPKEALKIIKQSPNKYKLFIFDQIMPLITGVELAKEVKKLNILTPVVICTGYSPYEKADLIELGITDLLKKPIDVNDLVDICDQYVNRSTAAKNHRL